MARSCDPVDPRCTCPYSAPARIWSPVTLRLLFAHCLHQFAPALRRTIGFNTQYRTSNAAENLGRYISCAQRTAQEKDFELILTVKMETRHPVEGPFGGPPSWICLMRMDRVTDHKEYLMVVVAVRNLFGIGAVVSILCKF